jgi:hypothetical protein
MASAFAVPLLLLLSAGGTLVPYALDEEKNWAMDMDSLKAAVKKARSEGKAVRGLVFINPGALTCLCRTHKKRCCLLVSDDV